MKRILAELDRLEKEIDDLQELKAGAQPRLEKLYAEEEKAQSELSHLKVRELKGDVLGTNEIARARTTLIFFPFMNILLNLLS